MHNNIFVEGTQKLKEHLIDDLDYGLIPDEGWNKLYSWYGMLEGQVCYLFYYS
jgi:hypothetical protein